MDNSTSKFHDARPYAVLPISPALAALYTHQSHPPQKNSDWCSKCGAYLLNGTADVRVARLKSQKQRHPTRRVLRITCQSCGWRLDVPTSTEKTPSDLAPNPISLPTPPTSTPSPLSLPPVAPQASSSSTQTKSRNKKKTGLQVLLSRNREKEAQERSGGHSDQINGGLAAFLSGL